MSSSVVPVVYQWIIQRTIGKVRSYWEENGLDPSILEDIEKEWESKIVESDVAAFTEEQKIEQQGQMLLLQNNKPDFKKKTLKSDQNDGVSASQQGEKKKIKQEGSSEKPDASGIFGENGDNDADDENLDDLGLSDDESDFETRNHIICQYEKVSRNKQRWKSKLRDGVIHVNGNDYIFQKADGEFDWV